MEQMNILNPHYVLDSMGRKTIVATIDDITLFVPLDPANRHYAEIMRQVELGELTIQAAE